MKALLVGPAVSRQAIDRLGRTSRGQDAIRVGVLLVAADRQHAQTGGRRTQDRFLDQRRPFEARPRASRFLRRAVFPWPSAGSIRQKTAAVPVQQVGSEDRRQVFSALSPCVAAFAARGLVSASWPGSRLGCVVIDVMAASSMTGLPC